MKRVIISNLILVLVLLSSGCVQAQPTPELTPIRLPVGYIPNIQFAPLYVAIDKGYFKEAGLDVVLDYNMETDSVALLGANQLQFAIVSGEQILLGRAQQLPVVYVMAWYQQYPVGVTYKNSSGIQTISDLQGKHIGLPGTYGASYIGLEALLFAGGLTDDDVFLDSIGFTQVEALATDRVDAVVSYIANEPIQLTAQGYDVTTMRTSDYLSLVANGLVTNEQTLQDNPDLVQNMVTALLKGLVYTSANPDEAYDISKKFIENLAQADEVVQKEVLKTSIALWQADRMGYSQPESWANMQDILLRMNLLKAPLALDEAFTNQFIPEP
jgi:NitT/TauT family transport system substrate-binding protein